MSVKSDSGVVVGGPGSRCNFFVCCFDPKMLKIRLYINILTR